MACLLLVFALAMPRIGMVLLWFFSHWFDGVFHTLLWPILGFLFFPTTLLWYTAVHHWYGGQWSGFVPIAGLIIALLIDLSPTRARYRQRMEERG